MRGEEAVRLVLAVDGLGRHVALDALVLTEGVRLLAPLLS